MKQNLYIKKKTYVGIFIIVFLILVIGGFFYLSRKQLSNNANGHVAPGKKDTNQILKADTLAWKAPEETDIPAGQAGDEIRYGKELIAHTAIYFGPKGKVAKISNGMNCQNCHNQAGTKPYGLNFSAVAGTFPQFRNRSESWVSIAGRISSCFHRSLNGQSPDTSGKEIKAMIAYMMWVGKNVPKGIKPKDAGILKLNYLNRPANPVQGKIVYTTCQTCHGKDGQGQLNEQGTEYIFPPLWGKHSYNDGAGLYRLGNFAGFVKGNMPFGTTYKHPVLTDEQAWDVAAFVNSKPRPHKNQSKDYSIITDKPIDFPFGPYADNFTEKQHKYGPYKPILEEKRLQTKNRILNK
jgi:thiosulfate dehydrogenase